ncbi:MAG TPA: hypothetical protein PKN36_02190 [bacterium]|nr:hypothetical protein [bacterium]
MNSLTEKYAGKRVVVDTDSRWAYLGTFKSEDPVSITLEEADAFDHSEISLSKHEYMILVKNDGIAPNRKEINILKNKVIAITLLKDILDK